MHGETLRNFTETRAREPHARYASILPQLRIQYGIAGAKGHTAVVEWLRANGCPQQPDDDELSELSEGSDLSEESDVAEDDEGEDGVG